jgi:hypothetical protein
MARVATTIQIDASAHCQLACPACPTASGATRPGMGAGHLDPARFEALLVANPEVLHVELSNYGEMFLNPRLSEILRIARDRTVTLAADNGVNMNHVSEETLEALVRYGFRSLSVSLDGASAETYPQYRVKGDFDRVIGNIRKLNEVRRKHKSGFPLLRWQFVVFGHNEHEITAAKKLATELGMSFSPKISWDDEVSPVRDRKLVQIQTGLPATREEFRQTKGFAYDRSICYQLWRAPVLNWDGRLMGCCRNFWADFGVNVFETGLRQSLETAKLVRAKEMLTGRAKASPEIPCTTCDVYLGMQQDRTWIGRDEVWAGMPESLLEIGIVIDPGDSEATHADVFIGQSHEVNRVFLARPPQAQRFEIGKTYSLVYRLPAPGEYTIYALPKRLDPEYRKQYPAIPPVTVPITVPERPAAQEFLVRL